MPTTVERGTSALRRQRADLLVALVERDIVVGHRHSALGIAWSYIAVLAQFGLLLAIFTRVVDLGIESYASFLLTGLLAWTFTTRALTAGASSITSSASLFRSPGFPAWALPASAVLSAAARWLLLVPVLVGVVAIDHGGVPWTVVLLPLVFAGHVAVCTAIATAFAAANVRFRDAAQLLTVGLNVLFYATPVFYADRAGPAWLDVVHVLNPFAHLVEAHRAVTVDGELPAAGFAVVAVLGVVGLVAAVRALALAAPRLQDEL